MLFFGQQGKYLYNNLYKKILCRHAQKVLADPLSLGKVSQCHDSHSVTHPKYVKCYVDFYSYILTASLDTVQVSYERLHYRA